MELVDRGPCRECGVPFQSVRQKGRPPVRCEACRAKIAAENQAAAVAAVDEETLFRGPKVMLKGDRNTLPAGAEAQCVNCWRIFTSDSSCEGHKDYRKNPPCNDPADLGYVAKERRGLPIWVRPSLREFD